MILVGLIFAIAGMFIGAWAALRRGFSVAGGVVGGLVLGAFSPLMFFVAKKRRCPSCAEMVKDEARTCKHCHAPLPVAWTDEGGSEWVIVATLVMLELAIAVFLSDRLSI